MKAGSSAGAGVFDAEASVSQDEQQQQPLTDEQKRRKALIELRTRQDMKRKKQQQALLESFGRNKKEAIVVDDDDEEEKLASTKAWEEEKAATSKQGSVNQMALASKRRQERRLREQQQQETTGSSRKAGSSKDVAIFIDGDDDEEAETGRKQQQKNDRWGMAAAGFEAGEAATGKQQQPGKTQGKAQKPAAIGVAITHENQRQQEKAGSSKRAAIDVDDEEEEAASGVHQQQQGQAELLKTTAVGTGDEWKAAIGNKQQQAQAASSRNRVTAVRVAKAPAAQTQQHAPAGSSSATAIDVEAEAAPEDEGLDYYQHEVKQEAKDEEGVAAAVLTPREEAAVAVDCAKAMYEKQIADVSWINLQLYEDTEKYLDLLEEFVDLGMLLIKTLSDIRNLPPGSTVRLQDCPYACLYLWAMILNALRDADPRLPEDEHEAGYNGMTGVSGKQRAGGHRHGAKAYPNRLPYLASSHADDEEIIVVFPLPDINRLFRRALAIFGTTWGLTPIEFSVALLSSAEAVHAILIRSCRTDGPYNTFIDDFTGRKPTPGFIGLNAQTCLENALASHQGRHKLPSTQAAAMARGWKRVLKPAMWGGGAYARKGRRVKLQPATPEERAAAQIASVTSSGWAVKIRVVDRSEGDGNDEDDEEDSEQRVNIGFNLPHGVLNKVAHITLPRSTVNALGLVGEAPGTHISARFKLKRRDDVEQVAFMGSLEHRRLLMLYEPQIHARGRSAPLTWINKFPSGAVCKLIDFFRGGLDMAPLSAIVRSRFATWSLDDVVSEAASGLARSAHRQGLASNMGDCRLAGVKTAPQEGKKQKGLNVRLVDRTGSPISWTLPIIELPDGDIDVCPLTDPLKDVIRYAVKQRSDLSPVQDDDYQELTGTRPAAVQEVLNISRLVIGRSDQARTFDQQLQKPDDEVVQRILEHRLPFPGINQNILSTQLARPSPLRGVGTLLLGFDLKKSEISWYDENGKLLSRKRYDETKAKDRAGMVAKAIKEHLAAAKAGGSGGAGAQMTPAKRGSGKDGSTKGGLGGKSETAAAGADGGNDSAAVAGSSGANCFSKRQRK